MAHFTSTRLGLVAAVICLLAVVGPVPATMASATHIRAHVAVVSRAPVHSLAVGESWACGIRSNLTVACWGQDSNGQAPTDCATNSAERCYGHFVQLAAGGDETCGIRTNSTVACWGGNTFGDAPDCATVTTAGCYGTFVQIAVHGFHSCGIHSDGTVTCWGYNSNGQAPTDCLTNTADACHGTFTQIAAADYTTCAVRSDGTVACWGYNGYGLGPTDCATNTSESCYGHFSRLSGDYYSMCGIKTNLTVACWGDNAEGQAPADCVTNTAEPCHGTFVVVATGNYSSCGLTVAHAVKCWGESDDTNDCVKGLPDCTGKFRQLSAGSHGICGIRANRTISCWGNSSAIVADCATNKTDACYGTFGPLGSNLSFAPERGKFTGLTEAPAGVNGVYMTFKYRSSTACKKGISSPSVTITWTKVGAPAGAARAVCSAKTKKPKYANALALTWNDSGQVATAIWRSGATTLAPATGLSAAPDGALINLCPYKTSVCKSTKSTLLTGLWWTTNGVRTKISVNPRVKEIQFAGTPQT